MLGLATANNVYSYPTNPTNFVDPDGLELLQYGNDGTTRLPDLDMRRIPYNAFDVAGVVGVVMAAIELAPYVGASLVSAGLARIGLPLMIESLELQQLMPLALYGLTRGTADKVKGTARTSIFANPKTLTGACPDYVAKTYRDPKFNITPLQKGSLKGKGGMSIRELGGTNRKTGLPEYTDRYIQWHPGSRHHKDMGPYLKVSTGVVGTVRVNAHPSAQYTEPYDH
jgi:hypothetical protein